MSMKQIVIGAALLIIGASAALVMNNAVHECNHCTANKMACCQVDKKS